MEPDEAQRPSGDLSVWMETFRGLDLTDAQIEAAAERLRGQRDQALPLVLAQFADPEEDAALLAVATVTLQGWAEPYPVKPLMALLQSPGVGALAKALIMMVLEGYGIDISGSDLLGVGINLEDFEVNAGGGPGGVSHN